jgi:predicted PurR-regulated permease PerM
LWLLNAERWQYNEISEDLYPWIVILDAMNGEWKTATKYVIGVMLAIAGFYIIYLSRSVIYLLLAAALIAFVLRPLVRFLNVRLRFPQGLAVFVAHLIGALVIILAPLVLIPPVLNAVNSLLGIDFQSIINNSLDWLESSLMSIKTSGLQILGVNLVLDSVVDPLLGYLQGVSPEFQPELPAYDVLIDSIVSAFTLSYGLAVSLVGSVFAGIVAFAFMLLASIYFSFDGSDFYRSFLGLFPEEQKLEIIKLTQRIRYVWDGFFRGQLALMIIIGFVVWLGLTILGVPGALALAFIAGLFEIIPSLGPILAALPAILVALISGSNHFEINNFIFALIVIGFYLLVQGVENYYIVPQVFSEAVELHPLVVMAGVLAGASIWGLLGALLAAPIIGTGKEVFQYLHRKMLNKDPFPPPPVREPGVRETRWESLKTILLRGRSFAESRFNLPAAFQERFPGEERNEEELREEGKDE